MRKTRRMRLRIFSLLLAALLLVPAVKAAAVEEEKEILGVYEGTYTAAQGITGVTLSVFETEDGVEAAYRFYPVASNPSVGKGIFSMSVEQTPEGYVFDAKEWVDHTDSPSYSMVDLTDVTMSGDGNALFGTVLNESGTVCGQISAERRGDMPVPQEYIGTWSGRYEAAQGITGLTLDIYRSAGQTMAAFHFYPVEENPGVEEGLYLMTVTYSAKEERCRLEAVRWRDPSATYRFVDLDGSIGADGTFSGNVTALMYNGSERYTFSLEKSGSDAKQSVSVPYAGGTLPVRLEKTVFDQDASVYHRDIAALAAAFSGAACDKEAGEDGLLPEAYETLGFPEENTAFYTDMNDGSPFSIASRNMEDNVLLTLVLSETQTQAQVEAVSDIIREIRASEDSEAFYGRITGAGFYDGAMAVRGALTDYLFDHPAVAAAARDGRLRVLVTGYGAGAAKAQMAGVMFNEEDAALPGLQTKDVFVYTFASPNVYYEQAGQKPDEVYTDNIFNISNTADTVTLLPAAKMVSSGGEDGNAVPYRQFGHVLSFTDEESPHSAGAYVTAVTQHQTQWNDSTHAYQDTRDIVSGVIAGPADVTIRGTDGTVLATSTGDEVTILNHNVVLCVVGDAKSFSVCGGIPYEIGIDATDTGTMYAAVFSGNNDSELSRQYTEYRNIRAEAGKHFLLTVPEGAMDALLYVTNAYGDLIASVSADGSETDVYEHLEVEGTEPDAGRHGLSILWILILAAGVFLTVNAAAVILIVVLVTRKKKRGRE